MLEALLKARGPISAEDIADGLGGRMTESDIASVYRNLETLGGVGLVRHFHAGHGPGRYVLEGSGDREYLACESCGALEAVEPSALDPVRNAVREISGFEAGFSHFPIVGLCAKCARKKESRPKRAEGARPDAAARRLGSRCSARAAVSPAVGLGRERFVVDMCECACKHPVDGICTRRQLHHPGQRGGRAPHRSCDERAGHVEPRSHSRATERGAVRGRRSAVGVEMEQPAVSHQLRILRDLGLVLGSRSGRHVIYGLYDSHVATLLDEALRHIEHLRHGAADTPARPIDEHTTTTIEGARMTDEHTHDAPHAHEHEHDGETHAHAHTGHDHEHVEHEHDHEHDGDAHAHPHVHEAGLEEVHEHSH